MEAVRDFIRQDSGRSADSGAAIWAGPQAGAGQDAGAWQAAGADVSGVEGALVLLRQAGVTAVGDAALWGFQEAADFAGNVEELSRTLEFLQVVAAGAVDRTRKQAASAAPKTASWTTGWRESPQAADPCAGAGPAGTLPAAGSSAPAVAAASGADSCPGADVLDDGYRNSTEFLRARLRISAPEARRRLALAGTLLPRQGFTGEPLPPVHPELGAAVAAGAVPSRSATLVSLALDRVRHVCEPEAAARMEHALTRTAAENDPDFLTRIARRWTDALDQDGAEPSEELLRQLQGAFLRKPRHGLQHLEIFATTEQYEHLVTVMNTATNPRTGSSSRDGTADPDGPGGSAGPESGAGAATEDAAAEDAAAEQRLDLRTRPQRLLDGLVGACKLALATGNLPATGGLRPQVMVSIGYRDLLEQLGDPDAQTRRPASSTGSLLFTGPVTASTVRKIACDADIIPVLLGGNGRVLDIGRASRVFPPHIRKALTARDGGCAFPGCTIPAPWCEAHHITYWSRGGTTGTENGVLLCSSHHHVIHKENWTIQLRTGIPWFIPPPHLDPAQKPRRNSYFQPADLDSAA